MLAGGSGSPVAISVLKVMCLAWCLLIVVTASSVAVSLEILNCRIPRHSDAVSDRWVCGLV